MRAAILIVDDSPTMRSVLRLYLREVDFDLVEAESAARALQLARLLRPVLAIIDLQLGDEDGIQLAADLRAQQQREEPLMPVLLLTGEAGGEWMQRAERARIDGILHKPVSASLLREKVEALVTGGAR